MDLDKPFSEKFIKLRRKAEKFLSERDEIYGKAIDEDPLKMIHEFQTMQIELELQNEELRLSQQELAASRESYVALYEFAPVGYLILGLKGLILKSNLAFADMLSIEREYLINRPFSAHIIVEDLNIYYRHLRNLFELKTRQICELSMIKRDGTPFDVHLESTLVLDEYKNIEQYRIMVIDISEHKRTQKQMAQYSDHLEETVDRRTTELSVLKKDLIIKMDQTRKSEEQLRFLTRRLIDTREDECKKISRELHDALGQQLTAITFNLSTLRNDIPDFCKELLDDTDLIVDNMATQVRNLSLDLRPSMLDDLGLIPTLRWFINDFHKRTKIKIKLKAVELDEYRDENLAITIFRIVQESLNNVKKHAEATNVEIFLKREITRITGFIQDNGKGFDINEIFLTNEEKHLGLLGMKERISILGGKLNIKSGNGQGTRINIEIPI